MSLQECIDDNPGLADQLEDALSGAIVALDELEKDPPDNQAALGNIEGAVGDLEAALGIDEDQDPKLLNELMEPLANIAGLVAATAIDEAIAAGGDPDKIADAQQALANGDAFKADALQGDEEAFKKAVNEYKDALAKAESAVG